MKTNADHQRESRERRAAAYELVKRMAQDRGFMQHERDTDGMEKFVAYVNNRMDAGNIPLVR
jgi:hypothetical protein